ncbi:ATP-binding protein [Parapedobacter sp. 10938]|uniref:ATP-binding protein n=1 Tax=Parapedobacter flavus TaxID=3110225 RepID=UPI002DB8B6C3|nr:AAA family ATPase [Parapedobacter sp. 10938]MEC3880147.1 AAA family ATPase [Parapedobacter sp. 10938]
MDELIIKSNKLVAGQSLDFKRSLFDTIDWTNRLIGIMGARGTGKTTMLLQRLKALGLSGGQAVYLSLDDIYFTRNSLTDVVNTFAAKGGIFLFLDEVHKYPDWHREIKNLYDFNRELNIVFTGSSIIDMFQLPIDLSRRAIVYELSGLSFREFLRYDQGMDFPAIPLVELLEGHERLALEISQQIKPLQYFGTYLRNGYYPFYKENIGTYTARLEQVVRLVIEYDLAFVERIDHQNIRKILELLAVLAEHVPFTPNISDLSRKLSMGRNTLVQYFHYLDKARLINTLYAAGKGYGKLEKPGKVLLENPNLFEALAVGHQEKGSVRESFFAGQLRNAGHHLSLHGQGDFTVDRKFVFEVGGKKKGFKQIAGIPDSFVAADELESGVGNKIPLWLFGFLY